MPTRVSSRSDQYDHHAARTTAAAKYLPVEVVFSLRPIARLGAEPAQRA
jgi:hypothetical protein